MSLDAILRTALSGLNTNQSALRTTSQNIANVNTPGYARQEVVLATASAGGQSMGVEIGEVRRIVDKFLTKELIGASAYHGYYEKQTALFDRLVSLFGNPDDASSLNNQIDRMFDAFATLATDPTQTPRRIGLLSDIQNVADSLDRYGRQILNLRSEADTQIVSEIATINNALAQVHSLNNLISHEKETGGNPAALEEQRARAIEKISDIVDIRAVEKTNHKVEISTISGLSLLDDRLRVLQYNPPGQVETTVVFNSITVHHIDSTTGLPSATGVALEPNLRAGTLKGLVDTRDKELPDVALSLGEMSSKFIDLINQVHNENTAVPPPNTLTGRNVGALATDPHGFTGKMTFGILDSNNILTSSYEIDFAAPGLVTLQDVITNVNGNITGGTLALSNGVMSFDATAGTDGVSLLQNATTPSARGGRGFSHYFGMNDLLSGREVAHFDTGLTTASGHGFGASGTVSLEFRGPGGILADSHTLDFSAVGSTVATVLTDL
ncbi:MAG: flagellar hook-associated protein FlgK, partial [Rhodospirillaceae bacterium]|nr:flagellar hook-associated protein FlgK [Rhodospirillaceae bacterium]